MICHIKGRTWFEIFENRVLIRISGTEMEIGGDWVSPRVVLGAVE